MGLLRRQSQELDSVGTPLAGAKLHTYRAGTTTNKATYSDDGLTVANANPVLADGSGRFPAVYGERITADAFADYKLVLKTSADVTVWTSDNVSPSGLENDELLGRIKQVASNPLDYGAIGDGVANESAAVQLAVDNVSGNGVIDLLGLIYRCDSQISLASGNKLVNGKLDFSLCIDDEFIRIHGSLGPAVALTSNASYGDGQVVLPSVSGIASGDLLSLYDNQPYIDSNGRGEIVVVEGVSALTVTTESFVQDDYSTVSLASVKKITTIDDVVLEGLTIVGPGQIAGAHPTVSLVNARRTRIRDVVFKNADSIGVILAGCFDTVISGCSFEGGEYGLFLSNSTQDTKVSSCQFSGFTSSCIFAGGGTFHPFAASGVQRGLLVSGSFFALAGASSEAVTVGQDMTGLSVLDNSIKQFGAASFPAVSSRSSSTGISGNFIQREGVGTPAAISLLPRTTARVLGKTFVTVTGNVIATDGVAITLDTVTSLPSSAINHIDISDNTSTATAAAVLINADSASGPVIDWISLRENKFGGSVLISATASSVAVQDVFITGGQYTAITIIGAVQNISRANVSDCVIVGQISITQCANVTVSGVKATVGGSSTPIVVAESLRCVITGCEIFFGVTGISIVNNSIRYDGISITGNIVRTTIGLSSAANAIAVTSTLSNAGVGLVISDNLLSGSNAGTYTGIILVTSSLASAHLNGVISGNLLTDSFTAVDGITLRNVKDFMVSGNMGTGVNLLNVVTSANVMRSGNSPITSVGAQALTGQTYTVTNLVTDRTYDANASSVAELADVLGTLLDDLETVGILTRS